MQRARPSASPPADGPISSRDIPTSEIASDESAAVPKRQKSCAMGATIPRLDHISRANLAHDSKAPLGWGTGGAAAVDGLALGAAVVRGVSLTPIARSELVGAAVAALRSRRRRGRRA